MTDIWSNTAKKLSILLLSSAALVGCASTPAEVYDAAQPKAEPIASSTKFTDALTCMDNLFYDYGIRDIRVTTKGIPDSTGEINVGTRDMFISAVSRMSTRSRAFTYIDFEEVKTAFGISTDGRFYQKQANLLTPKYYVRGAITTFDEGVTSDNQGGGIRVDGTGLGANFNVNSSVVGLDMNVGETVTGLIVPGVASSNRIVVSRRSIAADASFDVEVDSELVGGFVQASRSKSEGMHTAIRTLVELNTIETLGKLTRVPYWRCFGADESSPIVQHEATKYYNSMTEAERVEYVQQSLLALGFYNGEADGAPSPQLTDAIGQYQSSVGILANGRINPSLMSSLLSKDIQLTNPIDPLEAPQVAETEMMAAPLYISLMDALEFPAYKVGQPLDVQVRLNDDANLYCFYQDGAQNISRIFPNRFQPDPRVQGGMMLRVPNESAAFRIIFEQAGARENVKCFASRDEIDADLNELLAQGDLTPLNVNSLDMIEQSIRQSTNSDVVVGSKEFLIR
ncbi:MAG: DUF4384 domain-containing protein [Pseudomonadota bacterium]